MGGKSHIAVTLPLQQVPAPGVVNPRLTARDHISPGIRDQALGLGWVIHCRNWGLSTQIAVTAAFLQHLARTLPPAPADVWHRHDGLGYWVHR